MWGQECVSQAPRWPTHSPRSLHLGKGTCGVWGEEHLTFVTVCPTCRRSCSLGGGFWEPSGPLMPIKPQLRAPHSQTDTQPSGDPVWECPTASCCPSRSERELHTHRASGPQRPGSPATREAWSVTADPEPRSSRAKPETDPRPVSGPLGVLSVSAVLRPCLSPLSALPPPPPCHVRVTSGL